MNEFWLKGYDSVHLLNILIHVVFGFTGISLGITQLMRPKGDAIHRHVGRAFMLCALVVSSSAAIGSVFFNRDPFLMTLTVSATYHWIAGWRVIFIRDHGPRFFDALLAGLAITYCVYFGLDTCCNETPGWSSTTVFATLGFLSATAAYDLLRGIGGKAWLKRSWLLEHIYKVVGALGAMVSAASGNLFVSLGALSQVGPSFVFLLITLAFLVKYRRRP